MKSMSDLNAPIAVRRLELNDANCVEVLIWAPQEKAGDEYHCVFKITGLDSDRPRYVIGGDGVQALMLAFERIGVDLYSSDEAKAGSLRWNGESDLGFPVPKGLEDLLPTRP